MAEEPNTTDEQTPDADEAAAGETAAEGQEVSQDEALDAVAGAAEASQSEDVDVQDAQLPEVSESGPRTPGGQVDILLDTFMPVEVRLGETELRVRELLQLGPGSVIALEKMAGEPLDLYLKGVRFATGQLVVSGDNLGVRINEILPRRKTDRKGPEDA
jgi:flagellar motor switch protein FliN/FliY